MKESTTSLFCEDKLSTKHFGLDKGYELTKLLQKFSTKTGFGPLLADIDRTGLLSEKRGVGDQKV